jgi:hypothetical protein
VRLRVVGAAPCAMHSIPGAKVSWFRNPDVQVLCADLVKAAGALGVVGIAVPKLAAEGRTEAALASLLLGGVVCIFSVLGALAAWRQKKLRVSLHDLEGCLHTLHAVLQAAGADPEEAKDPGIRVAIHVPRRVNKKGGVELEQVCDYICSDRARAAGRARKFSINCGLIGEVYRTEKIGTVERLDASYEAFEAEMVARWGYSKEQVKKLDSSVMSYLAVPLATDERGVEAIVYVDARRRKFFTKTRYGLVLGACEGIALFVGRRYS